MDFSNLNWQPMRRMGQQMRDAARREMQLHSTVLDNAWNRPKGSHQQHGAFRGAAYSLYRFSSSSSEVNQSTIVM